MIISDSFRAYAWGLETRFLRIFLVTKRKNRRNRVSEFRVRKRTKFLGCSMRNLIFMQADPVPQSPCNYDYTVGNQK